LLLKVNFILIALTLLLPACKTCETKTRIVDGFSKYISKALTCKNTANIKADLEEMCSGHDLCSKEKMVSSNGTWSHAALSCLFVTGKLPHLAEKNQVRWGCRKTSFDPSQLEKICEGL